MSNVIRQSGVTVVQLGPEYESLDDEAVREFGELLLTEATHADPPRLVIDLSETDYISSSFLEVLVRAWKRIKQRGGVMVLCAVQDFCVEVLQITRLNSLWPRYPTREDAVNALKTASDEGDGSAANEQPG